MATDSDSRELVESQEPVESISSERAVRCPCCGGCLEERPRAGNPFLTAKSVTRIVCVDCGLDNDILARAAGDVW